MACKRSEQCEHADICQYAKSNAYDILGGSCYRPKKPLTNDEWRRTCSAEDFAKFLEDVTSSCYHCGMTDDISQCAFQKHQCNIKEWLKEKHE